MLSYRETPSGAVLCHSFHVKTPCRSNQSSCSSSSSANRLLVFLSFGVFQGQRTPTALCSPHHRKDWLWNPGYGILWVARWMSNISELKSWWNSCHTWLWFESSSALTSKLIMQHFHQRLKGVVSRTLSFSVRSKYFAVGGNSGFFSTIIRF